MILAEIGTRHGRHGLNQIASLANRTLIAQKDARGSSLCCRWSGAWEQVAQTRAIKQRLLTEGLFGFESYPGSQISKVPSQVNGRPRLALMRKTRARGQGYSVATTD